MKMMSKVVLTTLAALLISEGRADDRLQVVIEPDDAGGMQAVAQVDVMSVARNGAVRDAAWYAKPFVAVKEVTVNTGRYVRANPGKSALAVAAGYVVLRGAQGKLDDDISRIRGIFSDGDKGSKSGGSSSSQYADAVAVLEISGDNNIVSQNITITTTPAPVVVVTTRPRE
jgi:hypothetical protein